MPLPRCFGGYLYEQGKGVPKNEQEAVRYYKIAAKAGIADAQYNLSRMCFGGIGMNQDKLKGAAYCFDAAMQSDLDALTLLGTLYLNGDVLPQDDDKAVMCWRKAALLGSAQAQLLLGKCFMYGQGVLNLAALQGVEEAKLLLKSYQKGEW